MRHLFTATLLVAASAAGAQPAAAPIVAKLLDARGAPAGTVTLTPGPRGVLLRVAATGLTPGWHGIHLHMVGDCSDAMAGFKKSGSHVHGDGASVHGLLNPAATDTGDLPNIWADQSGAAHADLFTTAVTMAALTDTDGSAVIVHAAPDDYTSQPIGGAGARVACAVVK